jgi:gliding motility-associated-like protein
MILAFFLKSDYVVAQNDYFMSNASVSDCKGNFFDSDNNDVTSGDYDHNEDYIFKICVKNAQTITLVFNSFCTEKTEDFLIIYDGSDTNATKLSGKLSGTANPGTFKSTSGCLTIYFHTDKSVACDGWSAYWTTKVKPIPDPTFSSPPLASCKATSIGVRFDQKFNCDSIKAGNFSVTGIINPNITSVTAVGCDGNNETDSFLLGLSTPLDKSGSYNFSFDAVKYDACDSAWQLNVDTTFQINDCPIFVILTAVPDTICKGTCTDITAQVTGGDSTKYNFTWTPTISGNFGPNSYCPTTSGWIKLRVTDGSAAPGEDSIWIEVVDPPQARTDTTVCRTNPPFNLTATPAGGFWRGKGITDSINGTYSPQQAGSGLDTVLYFYAGCSDDVVVNVRGIYAGAPNAACPGTSPFNVTGYSPFGGTWSGPNITSAGLFDPIDTGVFVVTYTWNGCTDTKDINVYPISVTPFDTTCQSTASVQLTFNPIGGRWSGPGFINTANGIFYPPRARGGSKTLIYSMNGCRDTTIMNVINIDARWNQIACPDAPPFNVYAGIPVGGVWSGVGITDTILVTYDASFIYGLNRTWYNDPVRYMVNGCVDMKLVYVRKTYVIFDTLQFCIEDTSLLLNWTSTRRSPGGGKWSGPGITGNYFNPASAGYGIHTTYYNAYGCMDSLMMVVHPQVSIQTDTTLCITDNAFILQNDPNGGTWLGTGIQNSISGLFDPGKAMIGMHKIYHISNKGCLDSMNIEVEGKPVVNLSGYDPVYCFKDSLFTIVGTPLGGTLTGTGITGNSFRPKDAGTGLHQLHYQFGTPTCFSADSVIVQVLDTLKGNLVIDSDSLCDGEGAVVTATAFRGRGSGYTYSWQGDPSTSRTLFQKPVSSSWTIGTFSDGCSDTYKDSIYINVFPKVEVLSTTSPIQCYGTQGFAEVNPNFADPYKITWFTSPIANTNRINVLVSNTYQFRMENLNTKCALDSGIFVPSYPLLKAYFITTPSSGFCLNPFDPILYVINFTEGATAGIWDFGDGYTEPYDPAANPSHVYAPDTNWYPISLYVTNAGGCVDSFFADVCLDDSVYLVVPTAFSPGVDGINDLYHIPSAGVTSFTIEIFNRWGERVYFSDDKNFGWDGKYLNDYVENGVYSYLIIYKGKNVIAKAAKGSIYVIR